MTTPLRSLPGAADSRPQLNTARVYTSAECLLYASSYACWSHARNSASTSLGVARGISKCQRFAEVCSARRTRELLTFLPAFSVRTKPLLRVATPAKADERTRWIDV